MTKILRLLTLFCVLIFTSNAYSAGYTCDSIKQYTACNDGYYPSQCDNSPVKRNGETVSAVTGGTCKTCPSGHTCSGSNLNCPKVSSVTVTYNLNGGTGTTPSSKSCTSGSSCSLQSGATTSFYRAGYVFNGWSTSSTATSGSTSLTFSANTTVYAVWTACAKGTYKPGSGTQASASCSSCPTGYTTSGTATTAKTSCYISCAAGTRVVTADATCTSPAGPWYSWAQTVYSGSTSYVLYCMNGFTSTGTAASNHDSMEDCTRTIQAGYGIPKTTVSARYIKFTSSGNTVNSDTHLCEIQAFANNGGTGTNLLSGKGGISGGSLTNATDGDWNCSKYSTGSTQIYDLGSIQEIGSIKFALYASDGRTYNDVQMYVSTDNSNWTQVLASTNIATQKKSTPNPDWVILNGYSACTDNTYNTSISGAYLQTSVNSAWACKACSALTDTNGNTGGYPSIRNNNHSSTAWCSLMPVPAGKYISVAKGPQLACTAGSYCPGVPYVDYDGSNKANTIVACMKGAYTSTTGQSSCTACTGKTTTGTGQTSCNATCPNAANVATWNTATWSKTVSNTSTGATTQSISNLCSIKTCSSGYERTGSEGTESSYVCTGISYTVTLSANGGTAGSTTSVTATYGSAMTSIATTGLPRRAGYTFAGYYDATSGGTQYYTSTGASAHTWDKASNTTLYAQWTECGSGYYCAGTAYNTKAACSSIASGLFPNTNITTATSMSYCLTDNLTKGTYINVASSSSATKYTTCTSGYICPGGVYSYVTGAVGRLGCSKGAIPDVDSSGNPICKLCDGGYTTNGSGDASCVTCQSLYDEDQGSQYAGAWMAQSFSSTTSTGYTVATNTYGGRRLTAVGVSNKCRISTCIGGYYLQKDSDDIESCGGLSDFANCEDDWSESGAYWLNSCQQCIPGTYKSGSNATAYCSVCAAGQTSSAGATACTACSNNAHVSSWGSTLPVADTQWTIPSGVSAISNMCTVGLCYIGYQRTGKSSATAATSYECTPVTYTITLDDNGGTGGSGTVYQKYATGYSLTNFGTTITSVTKPTKSGVTVTYNANSGSVSPASASTSYTFNGYYTATSGGTQRITNAGVLPSNTTFMSNTTLYAQWGCNGVTLPTPTRTGYAFNGWYTAASGGTKVGDAGATYCPTTATTIYAQWTANCNAITLNKGSNGGATGTVTVYAKSDDTTLYTNNTCTTAATSSTVTAGSKTNATFGGYYNTTAASGGTQCVTTSGTNLATGCTVKAATTFNAQYDCNSGWRGANNNTSVRIAGTCTVSTYTVTLNNNSADGGTCATSVTCEHNKACTLPSWSSSSCSLAKSGKVFLGWSTSNTATTGSFSATVTAAATYYAVWGTATCSKGSNVSNAGTASVSNNTVTCSGITCNTGGYYHGDASNGGTTQTGTANTATVTVTCSACTAASNGSHSTVVLSTGSSNQCVYTGTCATGYSTSGGANTGTTCTGNGCSCSARTLSCSAGYYLPANSVTCTQCEAGYKCNDETTYTYNGALQGRTACSGANEWQDTKGQTTCKSVTDGYYKNGNTAIQVCGTGYFCKSGARTACTTYGTGYTTSTTTASVNTSCYLTVAGGNVRNGTTGTTLTQCAAGTFKATHDAYYGTSYSCEACTTRTKYSAAGASSCSTVSTGYYTTGCNASNDNCTGQSQCSGKTYCEDGVSKDCPDATTHKRTKFPDEYYNPVFKSAGVQSADGRSAITQCVALTWYNPGDRAGLYEYANYNSASKEYDNTAGWQYMSVKAGYYLTTKGSCGAYAYYKDVKECPANSYCPGKSEVACSSSNQATVHTTNFGLESCPSGYPNSVAGADGITKCYSDSKSRAWTGSQVNGTVPTNCHSVSEWNACSIAACAYTAYSNSAGTGDGTVKTGCSTNNANCTKTVKSVTAKAGYHVNGTSCAACAAGTFQGTDGSTAASCTACDSGKYQDATGQSSCKSCPTVTSGYAYTSTTGLDALTKCTETKQYSSVSSNCASGLLTKTAKDANTWNTATSTLSAKAGSILTGSGDNATCTQCVLGAFSAGGSATSCTACQSGKTTSAAGQSSCNANCSNAANVDAWKTAVWNTNNTMTNLCTIDSDSTTACTPAVKGTGAASASWTVSSNKCVYSGTCNAKYYNPTASGATISCAGCPTAYPNSASGNTYTSDAYCYLTLTAGQQVASAGAGASACSAGRYCTSTSNIFKGTAGGTTTYTGTACQTGSYQDATGQTVCKACARGKTNSGTGNTAACTTACSNNAGVNEWTTTTWNNGTVGNLCTVTNCSSNYYKNSNACATCASYNSKYTVSANANSTGVNACYLETTGGNYVATAGAGQVACPANSYCEGGTKVYVTTGVGATTGGSATCASATSSKYTKSAASTSTKNNCYLDLTAGKQVASVGAGVSNCTAGRYCNSTAKVYYGGTAAANRLTTYTGAACVQGSYSAAGASACIACGDGEDWGKTTSGAGQTSCNATCPNASGVKGWTDAIWNTDNTITDLCVPNSCEAGNYMEGTTCPSCSSFANGLYPESSTGKANVGKESCFVRQKDINGFYIETAEDDFLTACPLGQYSNVSADEAVVHYGETSKCKTCPANTYADTEGSTQCTPCLENYTSYGEKISKESCVIRCSAGTYLAKANDTQCTPVGTGYWAPATPQTEPISQGQTSVRNACPAGTTTIGYGVGADEIADCGRILNVGSNKMYLRSVAKTEPALHVKIGNTVYYGNMSTETKNMSDKENKSLMIKYNNTTYSVYDDSGEHFVGGGSGSSAVSLSPNTVASSIIPESATSDVGATSWSASLTDGTNVAGTALCSATTGTNGDISAASFTPENAGTGCWCQITAPAKGAAWVYASTLGATCADKCAFICANNMKGSSAKNISYRTNLYTSAGITIN